MAQITKPPTLNDLPAPPPGKVGWPWTEQSEPLPEKMPDGSEWPRISIVTPSYNQGQFIEETIRSILLQGYPNLEYIIIDGGSTDETVDIIKKYQTWLNYWVSETDQGQADALNKGFIVSTGVLMAWLNSDDLYTPNSLERLLHYYQSGLNWWTGESFQMRADGTVIFRHFRKTMPLSRKDFLHGRAIICQASTFWTRELWEKAGSGLQHFHLAMDYELWLRFSKHTSPQMVSEPFAVIRTHDLAKTGTQRGFLKYLDECDQIRSIEYGKQKIPSLLRKLLISFWGRAYLAKKYDWKSWIGRRDLPFV